MIIVLFGAPGVGKGTQAALLSERMNIPHLSTGAALRAAIEKQTEIGQIAAEYVAAGKLAPDEVVTRIVESTLNTPDYAAGAILDGFPRNMQQAVMLDKLLPEHGKKVSCVINIMVERAAIVQRMLARKRKDDTPDVIEQRLEVYENETAPLLEYYGKQNGLVRTINGNAGIDTVHARIIETFS